MRVASYRLMLWQIGDHLILLLEWDTYQYLCALGDGKGKVTRHYFLKGIAKLLIHKSVEQFVEQQSISPDQFRKMMASVTLNTTDH